MNKKGQNNQATELLKMREGLITADESKKLDKKQIVLQQISKHEEKNIQNNTETPKWENLYPRICSEEILTLAYSNIRSHKGSTTKGVDGKSIDGFSLKELTKIS